MTKKLLLSAAAAAALMISVPAFAQGQELSSVQTLETGKSNQLPCGPLMTQPPCAWGGGRGEVLLLAPKLSLRTYPILSSQPVIGRIMMQNGRVKLYEGRASAYVLQSSSYYGASVYSPSSREQMIHAN